MRFALGQLGELIVRALRGQRVALDGEAIRLRHEATQLIFELLDTRALDLRGLVRGAERAIEVFPGLLPQLQGLLGIRQRRGGRFFGELRRLELRLELLELLAHVGELLLVALDVERGVVQRAARLRELFRLTLAQLAGVLDRLLGARDLRADLVITALHGRRRARSVPCGTRAAFRSRLRRSAGPPTQPAWRGRLRGRCCRGFRCRYPAHAGAGRALRR